jgi:DNA-directed RNA polymerase specialized sigma24 family protein
MDVVPVPQPASRKPWSLQDRLDERTRADLIAAYRDGRTAASLAVAHGLSIRSVKRLVAAAEVRRQPVPA